MSEPTEATPQTPEKAKSKARRGEGSIFKRGAIWWIAFSERGVPHSESSHSTKKCDAKALLDQRKEEMRSRTYRPPKLQKILVADLLPGVLSDYRDNGRRTSGEVQRRWRLHLAPFFDNVQAITLTTPSGGDLIEKYKSARLAENAEPSTINRELSLLGRMFSLAVPKKVPSVPTIKRFREVNTRKGFLPDGAHLKIIEYCPELWFRTAVEIGRSCGWRLSEILNLKCKQVDLISDTIRLEVGETKNGDGREVAIREHLRPLLAACITGKKPEDSVLSRPNGKPVVSFRSVWKRAVLHAGLATLHCPHCDGVLKVEKQLHCAACDNDLRFNRCKYRGLLFHDLRRTAARNLRRAGVSETVVMKIGGWRTSQMFRRYSIVNVEDTRDGMAQLDADEKKAAARRDTLQLPYSEPENVPVADKEILQ